VREGPLTADGGDMAEGNCDMGAGGLLGCSDCGRDEDGKNLVGCFPGRTSLHIIVRCCSMDLC
jgi:hypothetical protein